MKKEIGGVIKELRMSKNLKLKELCGDGLSISQLSNIENALQMPSTDKFMKVLSKLNVKYDEFILLMDDEYLSAKILMEKKLSELAKLQNTHGLVKLAERASTYYDKYDDVYFQHIKLISLAMLQLIHSNNDYAAAREYLQPIKDYLNNVNEWKHYELSLICNCLFMFDIESAIYLGETALKFIERNYSFYRNEEIACVLLNNIAIYSLDYSHYYHLALKYSQTSINLASTNNHATRALYARIIHQLACFKLENGLFNKHYLLSLIDTFKLLEWHEEFQRIEKFVRKHNISL